MKNKLILSAVISCAIIPIFSFANISNGNDYRKNSDVVSHNIQSNIKPPGEVGAIIDEGYLLNADSSVSWLWRNDDFVHWTDGYLNKSTIEFEPIDINGNVISSEKITLDGMDYGFNIADPLTKGKTISIPLNDFLVRDYVDYKVTLVYSADGNSSGIKTTAPIYINLYERSSAFDFEERVQYGPRLSPQFDTANNVFVDEDIDHHVLRFSAEYDKDHQLQDYYLEHADDSLDFSFINNNIKDNSFTYISDSDDYEYIYINYFYYINGNIIPIFDNNSSFIINLSGDFKVNFSESSFSTIIEFNNSNNEFYRDFLGVHKIGVSANSVNEEIPNPETIIDIPDEGDKKIWRLRDDFFPEKNEILPINLIFMDQIGNPIHSLTKRIVRNSHPDFNPGEITFSKSETDLDIEYATEENLLLNDKKLNFKLDNINFAPYEDEELYLDVYLGLEKISEFTLGKNLNSVDKEIEISENFEWGEGTSLYLDFLTTDHGGISLSNLDQSVKLTIINYNQKISSSNNEISFKFNDLLGIEKITFSINDKQTESIENITSDLIVTLDDLPKEDLKIDLNIYTSEGLHSTITNNLEYNSETNSWFESGSEFESISKNNTLNWVLIGTSSFLILISGAGIFVYFKKR